MRAELRLLFKLTGDEGEIQITEKLNRFLVTDL
jgi:hypothetical protein